MDINFHYGAVKVLACHAGFPPRESELIAYASQYVDDANAHRKMNLNRKPGVAGIRFAHGEFDPICTAHKDLDYLDSVLSERARRLVYVCFHFLPSIRHKRGSARFRRVTKNPRLGKQLVADAVADLRKASKKKRPAELIRLGVGVHSYADTWSHQWFSGYWDSANNDISDLHVGDKLTTLAHVGLASTVLSYAAPDIGHAEALTVPDRSSLAWECKRGDRVQRRHNCTAFLDAAAKILALLCAATNSQVGIQPIRSKLRKCFLSPVSSAGELRAGGHEWAKQFPSIPFTYDEDEWFDAALARKGGLLDSLCSLAGLDPLDYTVKKDERYFHFHAAAGRQRAAVEKLL